MVIWIIGLSGSGKTFFADKIYKKLKKKTDRLIWIDGDEIRQNFTFNLGYSLKDRKKNSSFIRKLCLFLESKGFVVICSILSIFPSHQRSNKKLFKKYIQIYIKANLQKLKKRNSNKVYKKKNVVGVNIKFPKPYKSNFTINNNFFDNNEDLINKIANKVNVKN